MDRMSEAVAHHREGRLERAAQLYVEVLRGDPQHADALHLLGLVMHRLGHSEQALGLMDRALAVDRKLAACHANRGLVLRALGRPAEAEESLRRAIRLRPEFPEAWLNLARTLHDLGDGERALQAARKAQPHPEAAAIESLILAEQGEYAQAAALVGDRPQALAAVARLALAGGDPELAAELSARALVGEPGQIHAQIFCDALSQLAVPPVFTEALGIALATEGLDHQRLDRAVHAALAGLDCPARVTHPLYAPWLRACLVADPEQEAALQRDRDFLIAGGGPLEALEALAIQCFYNEYAWPGTPPDGLSGDAGLAARATWVAPEAALPSGLARLQAIAIDQPAAERVVRIERIGLTDDPTSAEVRAMYEAHPYPRLVMVPRPPRQSLRDKLAGLGIEVAIDGPIEVLVAGCGTGQHALITANSLTQASVLAVDLSAASLARATRIAAEHEVDNVRFAQADLLALDALDRQFDVVESVGVLHHMADPLLGWASLCRRVRPGGVMRIGLYSERGRTEVIAARALVAERGWPATDAGIREARQAILALPTDHPARPVVYSPDFTSITGCRDLIFHVCEHRFTPVTLQQSLAALGLRFLGFQHALAQVPALFAERFGDADPTDLELWDALEADHPRLFSGMFVFWCAPTG